MQKVQYRKVGAAESLWVTHTVATQRATNAGLQWAQLDVTGGTIAAMPVQQQIYRPDATTLPLDAEHRGGQAGQRSRSATRSHDGSATPVFPSLEYAGRLARTRRTSCRRPRRR